MKQNNEKEILLCGIKKENLLNKYERFEWIGSINTYLYIVERINEHFDKLKKTIKHDEIEEEMFYLCVEILRVIPIIGNTTLYISTTDSICLLKDNIPFLIDKLRQILKENIETFKKIKIIRNKYEHEPHNVNTAFSTGSGAYSGIGIYYKNELISIDTLELTDIIYDLNILMNNIQMLIYGIEKEIGEQFDIYTKKEIEIIKMRKNIKYNEYYVRIPKEYRK